MILMGVSALGSIGALIVSLLNRATTAELAASIAGTEIRIKDNLRDEFVSDSTCIARLGGIDNRVKLLERR